MAATAIMYYTIGVYAFLAIGVTVTFIPLQIMLTKVYHKLRQVNHNNLAGIVLAGGDFVQFVTKM